MKALLKWFQN